MDKFWDVCDYLLDFEKVRNFQELCGLKGEETKTYETDELKYDSILLNQYKLGKSVTQLGEEKYCKSPNSQNFKANDSYTVHNWFLYYFFRFGSFLGQETFYITFIPFVFWNVDPFIGRKMIVVWVVTMYIGQALKDLIKWPRPSYPAFRLETRVQAEYGLPSTHAIAGLVLPFSFLLASYGRYDIPLGTGVSIATLWCLTVSLSRIYVGMHSFLDIFAGVGIGAVYLAGGWPFMQMVENYTLSSVYSPWLILISHFLLGYFYPAPKHYSTTRGDTVMILASGAGVHCASWLLYQCQIDLTPLSGSFTWWIAGVRFVIGGSLVAVVRAIVKELSLNSVCNAVGACKRKLEDRRRREVEVVYKFVTYACVGFTIVVAPLSMNLVGATF